METLYDSWKPCYQHFSGICIYGGTIGFIIWSIFETSLKHKDVMIILITSVIMIWNEMKLIKIESDNGTIRPTMGFRGAHMHTLTIIIVIITILLVIVVMKNILNIEFSEFSIVPLRAVLGVSNNHPSHARSCSQFSVARCRFWPPSILCPV